MKPKIYIAGPMRGYPNYNFPAFHAAMAKLTFEGWVAISPASLDCMLEGWSVFPPEGATFDHGDIVRMMRRDLNTILDLNPKTDAIYMLKGWEDSAGAKTEKALAECLGLAVIYEDAKP